MGGFFAVASKEDCVFDLFFGTDYHSHLGTRRGGMAVYGKKGFDRAIHNIENSLFGTDPIPETAIMLNANQYAIKKKDNHDKGQRIACGCMVSKDIGEYNTCPHLCEYCYANASKEVAVRNYRQHEKNPLAETITGK